MKKIIIIVAGDPNSINSELIFKSLKKLNSKTRKNIILIGNFNLIKKQKQSNDRTSKQVVAKKTK